MWEGTNSVCMGVLVRGQLEPGPQRGQDDSAHPPLGVSGPHVFQEDVWDFQVSVLSAPGPGNDDKCVRGLERLSAGRAPGRPQPPTPPSTAHSPLQDVTPGDCTPNLGPFGRGGGGAWPGGGARPPLSALAPPLPSGSAGWPIPGALLPPGVAARACTLGPFPVGHAGVVRIPGRPTPHRSF